MNDREFDAALRDVESDRLRGASELARRCLELLALSAEAAPASDASGLLAALQHRCDRLLAARPSMAPIENLLTAWKCGLQQPDRCTLQEWRRAAVSSALLEIQQSREAAEQAADKAVGHIGAGKTIITHSISSTVLRILERLKHSRIKVIATESRPLNEGNMLARRLSAWGIETQLITDAQIGLFVPQSDLALLGADALLPDGSLVNKAGSYLLALAAYDVGVPLYVCCESFKCRREGMGRVELEEMDVAELDAPSLPGVRARNVYFDITPARLISAWIDERGIHSAFNSQ